MLADTIKAENTPIRIHSLGAAAWASGKEATYVEHFVAMPYWDSPNRGWAYARSLDTKLESLLEARGSGT